MDENSRVIVIGASAGGVRALLDLAPKLNAGIAAPILVVLHIGVHRSQLAELLAAKGPNRAVAAQTGQVPEPGTLYIAPPDQHLLLESGTLRVLRGPKENHARPAINPLFRSAAMDRGARAVGVVLTGMLDDGAAGLRAIEACGGTTVVQDPHDAEVPSMPRSALAAVKADHVVALDDLAALLNRLASPMPNAPHLPVPDWLRVEHAITLGNETMQTLAGIADPSAFTCPDCGGALFELHEGRPVRFLCHTGHAFSLRALAVAQEQVTDEGLWSALRAVREKEAVLRRLADLQMSTAPGDEATTLSEAEALATFAQRIRSLIVEAPGSDAVEEPAAADASADRFEPT